MSVHKTHVHSVHEEISNVADKKKTILITAPYFPPHSGGLERYVEEVASGLISTEAWNVVVLTTSENNTDYVENMGNVEIHRLKYGLKVSNTPLSLSWFGKIHSLLKNVNPDIINVHTPVPGLGDMVSLLTPKKVPLVVTYHTGSMKKGEFFKDILIFLYEHVCMLAMLRKAKRIICSSDFVRNDFLYKYQYKSATVTPATNADLFKPNNSRIKTYDRLIFIAGLGFSEQYKGLETLLHAMTTLVKHNPKLTLTVVGDGNMRSEYETMVERLALKNHIDFKGKLCKEDVARQYQESDILVLPTSFDSSPTVVIEAMSCGLPVVSTYVGGIPKIIKEGETGILIEPNNVEQLQKALLILLNDRNKQIEFGKNGRDRVKQKYTWKERISAYEKELLQVTEKKNTVAHVVGYYPPHLGGMEIVAQELALEQARRGYDVRVLTSTIGLNNKVKLEKDTNYHVYRMRSIEVAHTPIMWSLPFRLALLPKGTLLHIHVAQVAIPEIALLIAKIRKFKTIGHFHLDVEPSGKLGWLFLLYKKYVFSRTLSSFDGVLVASADLKKMILQKYKTPAERIHIVTNGVNEIFFQERVILKPHTPFRVLAVGRLTVQKRMDRIIYAMKKIRIPAELTIVGDGEDMKKLKSLTKKQDIKNVTFVGAKNHQEIRKYHNWADVFVLPSEKEGGMPLVVIEAMAAGLPVVGSNLLGVRDVINGVGVLVEPAEPTEFARTLETLYNNPKKLKDCSKKSVSCASQYTWAKSAHDIIKVYEKVVQEK